MRLEHAIFTGPLDPGIELTEKPTPESYFKYYGGDRLGKTLKVWRVHEGKFPEVDVGLVASPWGFEDSPDAEVLSGGINSKGPRAVTLGRQGNFFLWGFFGDPSLMTPSARKVFVNTIHYMKKFDGHVPLVAKKASSREFALELPRFLKEYERMEEYVEKSFSEGVKEATRLDADKLASYLEANLEYLHATGHTFDVDADARALGISNRTVEILDVLAKRWKANAQDAMSQRLIRRYVKPEGFESSQAFETWVSENRPFLFFSDVGGYRWLINVHAKKMKVGEAVVKVSIPLEAPTSKSPVSVGAALDARKIRPGDTVTLIVRAQTAPSWHIYSTDRPTGVARPTTLKWKLPAGFEVAGDWVLPSSKESTVAGEKTFTYEGELFFRRSFKVPDDARPGPIEVTCEFGYQACDVVSCRAPTKNKLLVTAEIVR